MDRKINWSQFFISILGTAIGVALTFGVNGMVERSKKAQAQRLTAIMVIHDIDCTIDLFKEWKQNEELGAQVLQDAMKNRDRIGEIPADSLSGFLSQLVGQDVDYHFDTSKEKIFNSGLDTWQNLGNMKFMDNVHGFYYDRQRYQELINQSETWCAPIPWEEYIQLRMEGSRDPQNFDELVRSFLKKKLYDKRVEYYAEASFYRVQKLKESIDSWTRINEENKFLMGITDKELDDYIHHIDNNGEAVTGRKLKGTWVLSKESQRQQYVFAANHSFTSHRTDTVKGRWGGFSGDFTTLLSYSGTWEMKGDSLILIVEPKSFDYDVDRSGLVPEEGMQDSLDIWITKYREDALKAYWSLTEQESRTAFKARLDSSLDKMEWLDTDGKVRYLKRESGRH